MLSMDEKVKIMDEYKILCDENNFIHNPPNAFLCFLETKCEITLKG